MQPRRALLVTIAAFVGSGVVAWVRPLGHDAPLWSFFFLTGMIAIAAGTWTAFFLPMAGFGAERRVVRFVSATLPAFAIAIPVEWLLKMVVRGRLQTAMTSEILLSSRFEATVYALLIVAGVGALLYHARRVDHKGRQMLLRSLLLLALVPLSVWGTKLDLPMMLGILAQVFVALALLPEAIRPTSGAAAEPETGESVA